jgi:hypothetical protein
MLQSSAFTTLKMRHKIAKPFHVECVVYTKARTWSINPVVSNTKQRNCNENVKIQTARIKRKGTYRKNRRPKRNTKRYCMGKPDKVICILSIYYGKRS